jgi:hypothetical protein
LITGVPDEICFQTKPQIAQQQLRQALADWGSASPGADGPGLWQRQ